MVNQLAKLYRDEWFKDSGFSNYFTRIKQIPLGINSYRGKSDLRIITVPEDMGSDVKIIIGSPGSGKTTIMKNIYSWQTHFYHRPLMIIDPLGVEHHLSKFVNSKPHGLLRYFNDEKIQEPFGLKDLETLSPTFAGEEIDKGDIVYGFYPTDLSIKDWAALDISEGAAAVVDDICSNQPDIADDINLLYNYVRKQPRSYSSAKTMNQEFFIHPMTHDSLMKSLRVLQHGNFFTKDEELRLNPKDLIEKMKSRPVNLKFFAEAKWCRAYAGIIMNHIYHAREKKKIPPPCIAIDEADMLFPSEDKDYKFNSTHQGVRYVRRGRKHGISVTMATQRFNSLHEDICDFYKYLIVGGSLTSSDLYRLRMLTNPEIIEVIKKLRFDPTNNVREQILIRSDRSFDTFYPFNCPVEMFRETKYALS